MMRTFSRQKRIFQGLLWLVALIAVFACASLVLAAEKANGPTIAHVEIGFQNSYKLGCWTPVRVEVSGIQGGQRNDLRVKVTASDSDGVPTTASQSLPTSENRGESEFVTVYTQVGRITSGIQVALFAGDRQIDSYELRPGGKQNASAVNPLSATSELVVSLGATPYGLSDAIANRTATGNQVGRRVLEIDRATSLPTKWFGYDAVDVLIIPAGDGSICRELGANKQKLAAIERWVELGGRLIVLCDGKNAEAMLGPTGPLASFVAGKFTGTVRLPETSALERFAASTKISGETLDVPRLADVEGNIDAYYGDRPSELPLVFRTPRGFGEITFAGVEFSSPPLAQWPGRAGFLRALVQPYLHGDTTDASQKLVASGFNDLSGALRQQLGRHFVALLPIGFSTVAMLAIAYLVFLGPFDYLLIQRWLRKPLFAWISLALIIALFGSIAYAVGNWSKGPTRVRLNSLELDDFDMVGGHARGTFWATVYSPEATQMDLTLERRSEASIPDSDQDMLFSWWGLPGVGIGGMQSSTSDLGLVRDGYEYANGASSLVNVPVLSSGAKSLLARWSAAATAKIGSALTDADGLLAGTITNETGVRLRNARLLYGSWAYRLGALNPGERIEIGEQLSPRRVKTVVTRDAFGESGTAAPMEGRVFSADQATATEILKLMMFYDAAGGLGFAHLPNRYQAYCDLSRQLELGRAILVAEGAGSRVKLLGGNHEEIGSSDLNTSAVIERFILPVEKPSAP